MSTYKSAKSPSSIGNFRRVVAFITGSLVTVSMNPALANGATGSVSPPTIAKNIVAPGTGHAAPTALPLLPTALPTAVTNFAASTPVLPSGAYQMDLSATANNVVLGTNLFNSQNSVTINVGGATHTFQAGSAVTPAEYLAVQQVLQGGNQSIVVNASGAASGGQFSVNQATSQATGNLVIPQGVTAIQYVTSNNGLQIGGNLVNYGSLYDVGSNKSFNTGIFMANGITNESGAVISTVLPSSLSVQFPHDLAQMNLVLAATNDITNYGTISSTGFLTLTSVNGAVTNSGAAATVQAASDVNLLASTVNNTGSVSSISGNINFGTIIATDMTVNAAGGAFSALNGNINMGSSNGSNITLNGGDYLSQQLNIDAGTGDIEANVGNVTGMLNTWAGSEHFTAATQNLILGNQTITGDPTWFNTAGNVLIAGNILATGTSPNIAIIASQNIVAVTGAGSIDASSAQVGSGAAGNITMIAGANVTPNPPTNTSGTNDTGTTLTVTDPTPGSNGGSIFLNGTVPAGSGLTGASINKLTTAVVAGSGNGGNVTMAAYAGTQSDSGLIALPTAVTVTTSGRGNGHTSGTVDLYAGATSGTGITAGAITTAGTSAGGINNTASDGAVLLQTGTPTVNGGLTVLGGTVTGTIGANATDSSSSSIQLNGNINAGASTVTLLENASGGGAINNANGTSITTGTLSMASGTGGIGITRNINTNASTLTANAGTTANVNVSDSLNGTVTLTGNNTANNYSLTMTTFGGGSSGSISIANGQQVTGQTSVSLTSTGNNGNITQAGSGQSVTINSGTGSATLVTGGGNVGVSGGQRIVTNAPQLSADATAGAGDTVSVADDGASVTLLGTNRGDQYNLLMTNNGNIVLGSGTTAETVTGTTSVTLNAGTGSVSNANTNGTSVVTTPTASFTASGGIGGNTGTVGRQNGNISTSATTLTGNAGTTADVDITDTRSGGGNVALAGINSGNNYNLTTSNAGAGITIGNGVTVNGQTSVSLTAAGGGSITQTGTRSGDAITTSTLTLLSGSGSIGSSGTPITTGAGTLTASTGNGGSVFITDDNGTAVTLTGPNSAGSNSGNTFSLGVDGSLTLATNATVAGNLIGLQTSTLSLGSNGLINAGTALAIDLNVAGGQITEGGNAHYNSGGLLQISTVGNMDMNALGLFAATYGTLLLVAGGNITNSGGDVSMNTTSPVSLIAGASYTFNVTTPNTLTINGINGSGGSILLPAGSDWTFNTSGGNVNLIAFGSSANSATGQILLDTNVRDVNAGSGNVNIIADYESSTAQPALQVGSVSSTTGTINISSSAITDTPVTFTGGVPGTQFTSSTTPSAAGEVDVFGTVSTNSTITSAGNIIWDKSTANITAGGAATFYTNTFVLDGGLSAAPPEIISTTGGTIANTQGNLNLPNDLVFSGSNLAILSSGNINGTGIQQINLGASGGGGSLIMVAGFNFSPNTFDLTNTLNPNSATFPALATSVIYTVTTPSGTGGSINLPGVNINTSAFLGNGGNVFAAANGSITLGSINTSASVNGNGGNVELMGNGITVGSINTMGGVANAGTDGTTGFIGINSGVVVAGSRTVITNGQFALTSPFPSSPQPVLNGFTIAAGQDGGNVLLTGSISNYLGAITITTGGTGSISTPNIGGIVITSNVEKFYAGSGGIGSQANPISLAGASEALYVSTTGNAWLSDSHLSTTLLNASVTGSFNLSYTTNHAVTLQNFSNLTAGSVNITGGTGDLTIDNVNGMTTTTGNLNISALGGENLVIEGGGSMTAPVGSSINLTATTSGSLASYVYFTIDNAQLASVNAGSGFSPVPAADMTSQTFNGTTNVNAAGVSQYVFIDAISPPPGATRSDPTNPAAANLVPPGEFVLVGANGALNFNTPTIYGLGGVTGPGPVSVNSGAFAGTIASSGDLNLPSSGLTFTGQSLNILAGGNINSTGPVTIDLSTGNGNGGNLAIMAGFNFTPVAIPQTGPSNVLYSFDGASSNGGSVNLSNVNITTSANGTNGSLGNAGTVTILAENGGLNSGSISIGNISTTSAGGIGGAVTIIGPGGITTGQITTTGNVPASSGQIVVLGGYPSLLNGSVTSPVSGSMSPTTGTPDFGAGNTLVAATNGANSYVGNVQIAGINAGASSVTIAGSGVTFAPGSTIAGGTTDITTSTFSNGGSVTSTDAINLTNNPWVNLVIGGGGTLTANGGLIEVTTDPASIIFSSSQTFATPTALNASGTGDYIWVQSGATVTGLAALTLTTSNVVLDGAISGNALTLAAPAGSSGIGISNTTGNLNLPAMNFDLSRTNAGMQPSLTIMSVGNINSSGLTEFDLGSATTGSPIGGTLLTFIAGFNTTLPDNTGIVVLTTPSATGGSINLAGVKINNAGTGPGIPGGTVIAVAQGGSVNLGAIDVSANGSDGGGVLIMGKGISVGDGTTSVLATGTSGFTQGTSFASGDVVSSGIGPMTITNGQLQFAPAVSLAIENFNGNINVNGSITTSAANDIQLVTGGAGSINVLAGSQISNANTIVLVAGSGGVGTFANPISLSMSDAPVQAGLTVSTTGNAYVNVAAASLNLQNFTGSAFGNFSNTANQFILNETTTGATVTVVDSMAVNNLVLTTASAACSPSSIIVNQVIQGVNQPGGPNASSYQFTADNITFNGGVAAQTISLFGGANNMSVQINDLVDATNGTFNITGGLGSVAVTNSSILQASNGINILAQAGGMSYTGSVGSSVTTTNGSISITSSAGNAATTIDNSGAWTATNGSISIASAANQNLLIEGGGSMTSTGTINLTATALSSSSTNGIEFGTDAAQQAVCPSTIASQTSQAFCCAAVNVNATGATQYVQFDAVPVLPGNGTTPVIVTACNAFNINTPNIVGNPGGVSASPIVWNSGNNLGTIANMTGDVVLPGGMIFHGGSLAILSAANVLALGTFTIDLSNANLAVNNGNGGNLLIMAGYDFLPAVNGQQGPNGTVYTLQNGTVVGGNVVFGGSSSGGNVNLGEVNITTASTAASGGTVTILAHDGQTNTGLISVGNINTSGVASGGLVTLYGLGGISTGDINTTGATNANVQIVAGTPGITLTGTSNTNGFQVWDAVVNPGFTGLVPNPVYTATPSTLSGNINVGGINAGTATVTIATQGNGGITETAGKTLIANNVLMVAGQGGIGSLGNPFNMNVPTATFNTVDVATNLSGNLYVTDSALTVNLVNTNTPSFLTMTPTSFSNHANDYNLTLTNLAPNVTLFVAANVAVTADNDMNLITGVDGTVTLDGSLNAPHATLTAVGDVNIQTGTLDTGSDVTVLFFQLPVGVNLINAGGNINITAASEVNNYALSNITAGNDLNITTPTILNQLGATLTAVNNVYISSTTITNDAGSKITAGNDMNIVDAVTITNDAGSKITAGYDMNIAATGTITNDLGSKITAGYDMSMAAQTLANNTGGTVSAGDNLCLTGTTVNNQGTISATNNMTANLLGEFVNGTSHTHTPSVTAGGTMNLSVESLDNFATITSIGDMSLTATTFITNEAGTSHGNPDSNITAGNGSNVSTMTVVTPLLTNNGKMSATGDVSVSNGSDGNGGVLPTATVSIGTGATLSAGGKMEISVTDLTSTGNILATGNLFINGGSTVAAPYELFANDVNLGAASVTSSGQSVFVHTGSLESAGSLTGADSVHIHATTVDNSGTMTATTGFLTIDGTLNSGVSTPSNSVTNESTGVMNAGSSIHIASLDFDNFGKLAATDDLTINGGFNGTNAQYANNVNLHNDGGTGIVTAANIDIQSTTVRLHGSTTAIDDITILSNGTVWSNHDDNLQGNTIEITANNVYNWGTITSSSNMSITLTGGTFSNGSIQSTDNGSESMFTTGTQASNSPDQITSGGALSITGGSTINNIGSIISSDKLTLSASTSINNNSTFAVSTTTEDGTENLDGIGTSQTFGDMVSTAGAVCISTPTLNNSGTVSAGGNMTINNTSSGSLNNGTTVTFNTVAYDTPLLPASGAPYTTTITSSAPIPIAGAIFAGGTISITSGAVTNIGSITSTGDMKMTANSLNNEAFAATTITVSVTDKTTNQIPGSPLTLAIGPVSSQILAGYLGISANMYLHISDTVANAGTISATNNLDINGGLGSCGVINATSSVTNDPTGLISSGSNMNIAVMTLNNYGQITASLACGDADTTLTINGGKQLVDCVLTIQPSSDVNLHGNDGVDVSLTSGGNVSIQTGTLRVHGDLDSNEVGGSTTVNATGDVWTDHNGNWQSAGSTTITAANVFNWGTISANGGSLTITANGTTNCYGDITNGAVNNNSSTAQMIGVDGVQIQALTVSNAGTILAGVVDLSGLPSSLTLNVISDMTIAANQLTNSGDIGATGLLTFNGVTITPNCGTPIYSTITNDGTGLIVGAGGVTINATGGTLTNNGALVAGNPIPPSATVSDLQINEENVTNTGVVFATGNITITTDNSGSVTNGIATALPGTPQVDEPVSGETTTVTGNVIVQTNQSVVGGSLQMTAGGKLTIQTGTVNNLGLMRSVDQLSITAPSGVTNGSVSQTSTITDSGSGDILSQTTATQAGAISSSTDRVCIVTSSLNNMGSIAAATDVLINNGFNCGVISATTTVTNSVGASITAGDNIHIAVDTLDNYGQITASLTDTDTSLTINGGTQKVDCVLTTLPSSDVNLHGNGGVGVSVTSGGSVVIQTGTLRVHGDLDSNAGNTTVTASGNVWTDENGNWQSAGNTTITASNVYNWGTINAYGGPLTINAVGGAVNNNSSSALISSNSDLIIHAASVDNYGMMQSVAGSLTIDNGSGASTSVTNNSGATLSGINIGISSSSVSNEGSITAGGGWIAFTGLGNDGLTGGTGDIVQTATISGESSLTVQVACGGLDITPLLVQTSMWTLTPGGDGNATATFTSLLKGVNLLIVSSGDITDAGVTSSVAPINPTLDTSNGNVGPGGSITLIAGVKSTASGDSVSVMGSCATANGGSIDFANTQSASPSNAGFTGLSLNTSSTNGAGGNVQLAAFAGTNSGSTEGTISFVADVVPGTGTNPTSITTTGNTTNGNVLISAGGVNASLAQFVNFFPTAGNAITVGDINAGTSAGGSATIEIVSTQNPLSGNTLTFNLGNSTIPAITPDTTHLQGGSIVAGNLSTDNGVSGTGTIGIYTNATVDSLGHLGAVVVASLAANTIDLQATYGTIFLPPVSTTITASTDTAGNGGTIILDAAAFLVPNEGPNALTLNATANSATNAGGTVDVIRNASTELVLGNSVPGDLNITVGGTTPGNLGVGGTISVQNGGSMFVAAMNLTKDVPVTNQGIHYGAGADLTFIAGAGIGNGLLPGTLTVVGPLNVSNSGGLGGNLTLVSNSTTAFQVSNTAATNVNGVQGVLSVSGSTDGNVTIINHGGGITYTPATTATTQLSKASSVTLQASGPSSIITLSQAVGDNTGEINITNTATTGNGSIVIKAAIQGSDSPGPQAYGVYISNTATGSSTATGTITVGGTIKAADGLYIENDSNGTGSIAISKVVSVTSGGLTVKQDAGNGSIAVSANVTVSDGSAADLTASGKGTIATSGTAVITADVINTQAGTGAIGGTTGLAVNTGSNGTLTANGGSSVNFNDKAGTSTTTTLEGGSSSGTTFAVTAAGALVTTDGGIDAGTTFTGTVAGNFTADGDINAPKGITVKSGGATGIEIDGNLTANLPGQASAAGNTISLTTTHSGATIVDNAMTNMTQAAVVTLVTAASGKVGTGLVPFQITAAKLNCTSASDAMLQNTINATYAPTLTVATGAVQGAFTLSSNGNTVVSAAISKATNIDVAVSGTGNLTINAPITTTTSGSSITLSTDTGNITGTGKITSKDNVSITTEDGSIGTSTAAMNVVTGAGATLNIEANGGLANVKDTSTGATTLSSASFATGAFTLSTAGVTTVTTLNAQSISLTTGGNTNLGGGTTVNPDYITANNGSLSVVDNKGNLAVVGGSNITADNGSLTLQGNAAGTIKIGGGGQETYVQTAVAIPNASDGVVYIGSGAQPKVPVAGSISPSSAPVLVNPPGGGEVFFGAKGITVTTAINPVPTFYASFNARNTLLIFNATKAGQITVTDAQITADPPAPAATLMMPTLSAVQPTISTGMLQGNQQELAPLSPVRMDNVGTSLNGDSSAINSNLINVNNVVPVTYNTTTASSTIAAMLAAQAAGQATSARAAAFDASWISDTELSSGEIPAIVEADTALGIKPSVSTVVDMHVAGNSAPLSGGMHAAPTFNAGYGANGAGYGANGAEHGAKCIVLNKGSVVFAPAVDTKVQTAFGEINIAAHSLVLVLSFSGGVAVYDLDDTRKGAVSILSGNHMLPMTPGTTIVLSGTKAHSFDEVNPAQLFLYRNMVAQQLSGTIKAFVGEFMPQSAIHAVTPLRKLVNSKQPDARRLSDHLLKTAAIVVQTRSAKGAYKQILRPSVAAWAP